MSDEWKKQTLLSPGTYVLAISGGIDSVVLLDALARQKRVGCELVVAHLDHGIRSDSAADARFVGGLAEKYGLIFELQTVALGKGASEEAGRSVRYKFLDTLKRKYDADAIVTAHHADDVVETVVLNLSRGTGWRGLCSLRSSMEVKRPILNIYKKEIIEYAADNHLEWCEDSTNHQDDYVRNRIRHHVIPACLRQNPHFKNTILGLSKRQSELRDNINGAANDLYEECVTSDRALPINLLLSADLLIRQEILRIFLKASGVRQTRPQIERALGFTAAAKSGKRFSLGRDTFLEVRGGNLVVVTL